jgi:hypothetical protein
MIFLTFLSAFLLSGIAGYYSIVGLALIFPGAFWPVVVMGSALEFSKLVTASWLYRHWKVAPLLLKTYLTVAVCILMLITSMGIFGFLSKAHIEHSVEMGPIADKVAIYEDRVSSLKQRIEENKRTIKTMDNSVDQVLSRSTSEESATKSVNIRKSQQKERTRLSNENSQLQKEIAQIQEEKAPIMATLRKTEADVGPIKYVAELIYGSSNSGIIDKAVRLVIMIIMVVFDPLAVLLLISANLTLGLGKKEEDKPTFNIYEKWNNDWSNIKSPEWPKDEVEPEVVEINKENITNVTEDINEYVSPAKVKVETHHEEGVYSEEHKPFDHVKYDD